MGCSIHIITEIFKEGKWNYIEEVPESFNQRDYSLFGVLAGVRNSFNEDNFEPRGLPEDISGTKFRFESNSPYIEKSFKEHTTHGVRLPDGTVKKAYDSAFKKIITEEEYNELEKLCNENNEEYIKKYSTTGYSMSSGEKEYFVYAAPEGLEFSEIPNFEYYPSFEEYKMKFEDEWDEDAQDYGRWKVNFSSPDYHTPSFLSLKDFLDKDFSTYYMNKCKVVKEFWESLKTAGGIIPESFQETETNIDDIISCFQEAFEPTVTIRYPAPENKKTESSLYKGIEELKAIAEKYNVSTENIRIVFAFDN